MANRFWSRLAALAIGTSLAGGLVVAFAVVALPVDPAWIWRQVRAERMRVPAEAWKAELLADLEHGVAEEWAGRYEHSNGYEGHDLVLAPRGFFYEASHCTGTAELGYGRIEGVDGMRVRLCFEDRVVVDEPRVRREDRLEFRMSDELWGVPWGSERFLVPADQMVEFCTHVKSGGYDAIRYADFPRRVEDGELAFSWSLELEGLPDVPAEFGPYLAE